MGLFRRKADPDPNPGIGGYTTPRGPVGATGYPGSTAATRTNPPAAAAKLHDGDWGRQDGSRHLRWSTRRMPTITEQQARGIDGSHDGGMPFHGHGSSVNPDRVRDTEDRPRIVISQGTPGGQRQRNTGYYGGARARPGDPHAYRSAPNPGKLPIGSKGEPVTVPSRYVYGGPGGGTDLLDGMMTRRRMPYTGHGGTLQQVAPEKGGRSVRGAVLDGNRFYLPAIIRDTRAGKQGGGYGHYGARANVLHRPTIFTEPAPWSAQFYDTTSDTGGPDRPGAASQVVSQVHVSPSAGRRRYRGGR